MQLSKSQSLYDRALRSTIAGVHSNSRARVPHPIYFEKADGAHVWDIDGNRYVDLGMGNGAVLLGHNHPGVQQAVRGALESGLTAGLETEYAVRAAELLVELVPAIEAVRFTNTGTEALLHALQTARAHTNRRRIAKVEGAYHGWADPVFVSTWPDISQAGTDDAPLPLPGTGGLDPLIVRDTLILPFNNLAATRDLLLSHGDDLAAILVEPTMIDVGFIPANPDYLAMLREVADEIGALLIFDELLTGFRLARGGAQEYYAISADLSLFGKAIGNGYPVAALAGKRTILEKSGPGPGSANFVGTFNGHGVSMAATEATLRALADGVILNSLQASTQSLIDSFQTQATKHGVPAQMQGGGGHIHWYFADEPVSNYREAFRSNQQRYAAFISVLSEAGFLVAAKYLLHHAISSAHDQADLDQLVDALDAGLAAAAQVPA